MFSKLINLLLASPSRSDRRAEYNSETYVRAEREAMRFNHEYVGLEHLFLAIASETQSNRLGEWRRHIQDGPDYVRMGWLVPSPSVRAVMEDASRRAEAEGRDRTEARDVWKALSAAGGEEATQWARKLGADLSRESPSDASHRTGSNNLG